MSELIITPRESIIKAFEDNNGILNTERLIELTGLDVKQLQVEILDLDLEGLIRNTAPGTYQYVKPLFSLPADHPFVLRKPGLYPDVSFNDYCIVDAVNASLLKKFEQSPRHVHYEKELKKQNGDVSSNDNNVLFIGRAVHCAVLEPDRFTEEYIVAQCEKRNSKEYYASVKAHPGKSIITRTEANIIRGVSQSLQEETHSEARSHLCSEGYNELSAIWMDAETEVLCKGRADRYVNDQHGNPVIIDVKTTADASKNAFSNSVFSYNYHLSAAYYLDGFAAITGREHARFILIACEKYPPFELAVYELQPEDIQLGREKYQKYLAKFEACSRHNAWAGYPNTIQPISLPPWAYKSAPSIN